MTQHTTQLNTSPTVEAVFWAVWYGNEAEMISGLPGAVRRFTERFSGPPAAIAVHPDSPDIHPPDGVKAIYHNWVPKNSLYLLVPERRRANETG